MSETPGESVLRLVTSSLARLLKDAPRRKKDLKKSLSDLIEQVKGLQTQAENTDDADPLSLIDARDFFEPFKLCIETMSAKMLHTTFNCLQKLVAYGYFTGYRLTDGRVLMDIVVDSVFKCYEHFDSGVQIEMVRLLCTCVASTPDVHARSLSLAIRACFHVHLLSSDKNNKAVSRSALIQMVNAVFQRLCNASDAYERGRDERALPADFVSDIPSLAESTADPEVVRALADVIWGVERAAGQEALTPPSSPSLKRAALKDDGKPPKAPKSRGGSKLASSGGEKPAEQAGGGGSRKTSRPSPLSRVAMVQRSSSTGSLVLSTESQHRKQGASNLSRLATFSAKSQEVPGKYGLCVECGRPAERYCLQTRVPVCSVGCKQRHLTSLLRSLSSYLDPHRAAPGVVAIPQFLASTISNAYLKLLQKDASTIFIGLCKMAHKAEGPSVDSVQTKTKILALELIGTLFEHTPAAFQCYDGLVLAVRRLLCPALLRSAVSDTEQVFNLSISIFLNLFDVLREHLKTEVGIFLSNVFLGILENPVAIPSQRVTVCSGLLHLCQEPQVLVDVFINYDSDVDSVNLFEKMVGVLSRVPQSIGMETELKRGSKRQAAYEHNLQVLCVDTLVVIVESLEKYSQKLDDSVNESDSENADSGDGGGASGGASKGGTSDLVLKLEEQRETKKKVMTGLQLFKLKPKQGIAYLHDIGVLDKTDAKSMAEFFISTEGVSKVQMGEYFGASDPFNVRVMHEFVDLFDFKGMDFDSALRKFSGFFWLPGEAQKIDRIIEKFAQRFVATNENIFKNADTAYVLAFSTIMLNTDLHNPQNKNKMSKAQFYQNTKLVDANDELTQEYIDSVYDKIEAAEIKLKENDGAGGAKPQGTSSEMRLARESFSQALLEKSQTALKSARGRLPATNMFYQATTAEHIRPMFEAVAWGMLAPFSIILDRYNDIALVELALRGIGASVRLAASFDMKTEKNAFVAALCKFTGLSDVATKELRSANKLAIREMFKVIAKAGDSLGEDWSPVLRVVTEIQRLQLLGSRLEEDGGFTEGGPARRGSVQSYHSSEAGSGRHAQPTAVELKNAAIVGAQVSSADIDRVFQSSTRLTNHSIVEFMQHLVTVSNEEIDRPGHPRFFLLQKMVEVSDFNMDRIRYVFSQLWANAGVHFVKVGCHNNPRLAMYAVDALRQLAFKFLEKDELANYHFQRAFLHPFVDIFRGSASPVIQELSLQCFLQFVRSRARNIRSGWSSVFMLICASAGSTEPNVVREGLELAREIADTHLGLVIGSVDQLLNALLLFAMQEVDEASAVNSLGILADTCARFCSADMVSRREQDSRDALVALEARRRMELGLEESSSLSSLLGQTKYEGGQAMHVADGVGGSGGGGGAPGTPAGRTDLKAVGWDEGPAFLTGESTFETLIFPVLVSLATLVSDLRHAVRMKSVDVLFGVLTLWGSELESSAWGMVFRGVVLSVFDDIKFASETRIFEQESGLEWLRTTCLPALHAFVDMFALYFDAVEEYLYVPLDVLITCLTQRNEELIKMGVDSLSRLILMIGKKLTIAHWDIVIARLVTVSDTATPDGLYTLLPRRADRPLRPSQTERLVGQAVQAADKAAEEKARAEGAQGEDREREGATQEEEEEEDEEEHTGVREEDSTSRDIELSDKPSAEEDHDTAVDREWKEEEEEEEEGEEDRLAEAAEAGDGPEGSAQGATTAETGDARAAEAETVVAAAELDLDLEEEAANQLRLFDAVKSDCVLQLYLIQFMHEILDELFDVLPTHIAGALLSCLEHSYTFAHEFNEKVEVRLALLNAGFTDQLPSLSKQETNASVAHLNFLFRVNGQGPGDARTGLVEELLFNRCEDVIRDFCAPPKDEVLAGASGENLAMVPVVILILDNFVNLQLDQFISLLDRFFPHFVNLMESHVPDVRTRLAVLFRQRLTPLINRIGDVNKG